MNDQRRSAPGRLVLCGSMKAIAQMEDLADQLGALGVSSVTPPRDHWSDEIDTEAALKQKHDASRLHLSWIMAAATRAILVVNPDQPEIPSYIGPNAFAEIAVAFATDRTVFVLNGLPRTYEEELRAWRVLVLNGDLGPIMEFFGCASPSRRPDT